MLWRWIYGVPAVCLVWIKLRGILGAHTQGRYDLSLIGLDRALLNDPVGVLTADPVAVVAKIVHAGEIVGPDLLRLAVWLVPALVVVWVIASSLGRTFVLRRADPLLSAKPLTLMALQAIRLAALAASFWVWFQCIAWAAAIAVTRPIAAGQEPNLVGYCAVTIVTTIGLFVLWGAVSWVLSVAPLLAMLRGTGVAGSLAAAFRLGPMQAKLVEVNLVMGIIKIALIVLAMVFSATPLPFQSVASESFLLYWWAGVTVLYLVASDFFHVVRLIAYLDLWKAFAGKEIAQRA